MDWKSHIAALLQSGFTQQEIATTVGVTQPTISALAGGKTVNPTFIVGNKLKKLKPKLAEAKAV